MSDTVYTYDKPDDEDYFDTLVSWLGQKKERILVKLLEGGRCSISTTSSYSYKRWNCFRTVILFYVPVERLKIVNDDLTKRLLEMCQQIMPPEAGFDVMDVKIGPIIKVSKKKKLSDDLDKIAEGASQDVISDILPTDVKQKGKEMAEAYLYLYVVENSLRLFIEKVAKKELGAKYFDKLKMSKDIRNKITSRKQEEAKNRWIRIRGDSEAFYCDFKDIGVIISNNWDIFGQYFPDQAWILNKINELSYCRNLVAHNSYIGDHEKDVIRVHFNSILKQIGTRE